MGLPRGTFIVGNKLIGICGYCERIVRLDKPIIGSLHICITEEKRRQKDYLHGMAERQMKFKSSIGDVGKKHAKGDTV